jgi:hypothetical protein
MVAPLPRFPLAGATTPVHEFGTHVCGTMAAGDPVHCISAPVRV